MIENYHSVKDRPEAKFELQELRDLKLRNRTKKINCNFPATASHEEELQIQWRAKKRDLGERILGVNQSLNDSSS